MSSSLALGSSPHFQNLGKDMGIFLISNLVADMDEWTNTSQLRSPALCVESKNLYFNDWAFSTKTGMSGC